MMRPPVDAYSTPSLGEMLGKACTLKELITSDYVAACQEVIRQAKQQYFEVAHARLRQAQAEGDMAHIARVVADVRSQARVLGYTLIGQAASAVLRMLVSEHLDTPRKEALLVPMLEMLAYMCHSGFSQLDDPHAQDCLAALDEYLEGAR